MMSDFFIQNRAGPKSQLSVSQVPNIKHLKYCPNEPAFSGQKKLWILSARGANQFYSLGGVSWPSGLVHRTQVLVLSENQNVCSIPGSGTCVLEQDTQFSLWCVIHVKEPSTLLVKRRGLPRCFWLAPRNRQLDWWRSANVDWIGLDWIGLDSCKTRCVRTAPGRNVMFWCRSDVRGHIVYTVQPWRFVLTHIAKS